MVDTYKLKGHMAASGYSQRKLAKEIGISKNTLNTKINGLGEFDTSEIVRICEVLKIDSAEEKCAIFLLNSSQNRDSMN